MLTREDYWRMWQCDGDERPAKVRNPSAQKKRRRRHSEEDNMRISEGRQCTWRCGGLRCMEEEKATLDDLPEEPAPCRGGFVDTGKF